ncbi:MAG: hypothetical protein Q8936_01110 [Bacillota bacterium]|nr:hypothetical protein [Bacillota bacterium]
MVAFNEMWNDVSKIIKKGEVNDIYIVECFKSGFTVQTNEETEFVTKEDFVDFWCRMLYYNEVSKKQIMKEKTSKAKYIYSLISQLPYVTENSGVLRVNR